MSKPVCLVLLMTVVVGSVDFFIMGAAISALLGLAPLNIVNASLPFVIVYFFVALVLIFYPVMGSWLIFIVDDVT